MKYLVKINGRQIEVEIEKIGAGMPQQPYAQQQMVAPQPVPMQPAYQAAPPVQQPAYQPAPVAQQPAFSGQNTEVVSPLSGSVFDIQVSVGQSVQAGQTLVIIEAMKMENEIVAPSAGTVKQILVSKGTMVETNDVLVVLS